MTKKSISCYNIVMYTSKLVITLLATIGLVYSLTGLPHPHLYKPAYFNYEDVSLFDNTWGTYVTDYILFVACSLAAVHVKYYRKRTTMSRAVIAMLICYAVSVLLGALAHHFIHSEMMHTILFRAVWTGTVGCVVLAGAAQGLIANELYKLINAQQDIASLDKSSPNGDESIKTIASRPLLFKVPPVSTSLWLGWAITLFLIVCFGGFSMARPAADIFLAGITQSIPTFYIVLLLLSSRYTIVMRNGESSSEIKVVRGSCYALSATLMLNSPLLFAYPHLVASIPALGVINGVMHCVLFVAWVGQYRSLLAFTESSKLVSTSGHNKNVDTEKEVSPQEVNNIVKKDEAAVKNEETEKLIPEETLSTPRRVSNLAA